MKSLLASLLALVLGSVTLHAQAADAPKLEFPAASPAATIKQRVGITDIEINYSRPSRKDRAIFGSLVPYGEVWRTGANQATKVSFSTPVKVNGTDLPAGTYELFTIPRQDEWTVIFHKPMSQWGAYAYDEKNDVARVTVKPIALPNTVETFTIALTDLRDESATMYLAWEKTRVPLKLEWDLVGPLVPKIEAVMASDAPKKPYAQAAMFYFQHELDLQKALTWIDAAIAQQPEAFYFYYHKARMLAKLGDKPAARAAAEQSIAVAQKAGGAVTGEYIRLNQALLASLN